MSRLTPIVEALVAAGATPDMILAAVRAHEAVADAEIDTRRRNDAERQARRRERRKDVVTGSHVTSRDVTVTERDAPCPLPSSPQTPQLPTPTPENNTRTRKGRPEEPLSTDVTERIWRSASKTSRDRSGRPALAKAVLAAIRSGATDDALLASVKAHCESQGEFAKGVHLVVTGEHWRDHVARPAGPAQPPDPAVLAHRIQHHAKTGEWKPAWGPKPVNDQPNRGAAA